MTTLARPVPALSLSDVKNVLLWPVLAGLLLGIGDLVLKQNVDYPWANLANSSAVWAVAAFVLGAALRTDPVRAAVAGVVMLLVAVEAYYAYAAHLDLSRYPSMLSPIAQMWMVFGVFAGVIFGVAGAWTRGSLWWQRVVGASAGAAVLLGEALHTVRHLAGQDGQYRTELEQTAALMAVLGVVVLILSTRRPSVLAAATVLTPPIVVFSAAAFSAVGIAY